MERPAVQRLLADIAAKLIDVVVVYKVDRLTRSLADFAMRAKSPTLYRQVPFDQRLRYILASDTFVYDEANKTLYLNGAPPFAGTLYIDHIKDSPDITNADSSSWVFPSWSHALLGFYAVAINKGGVDYDDINARMAPDMLTASADLQPRQSGWAVVGRSRRDGRGI